jgi:hypothetical protein
VEEGTNCATALSDDREGRWLFSSLPLSKRSRMRALGVLERAIEVPAKNVRRNPENQHL